MKVFLFCFFLCSIAFSEQHDMLAIKATRYSGTVVNKNDYIDVDWYNPSRMKTVHLLQPIDEKTEITVDYEIKDQNGVTKVSSHKIKFCNYDPLHPDGHMVSLLRKALSMPPQGCPIEAASYQVNSKQVSTMLGFGFNVDCDDTITAHIKLKTANEITILEGTWGMMIMDKSCHNWFPMD